MRRVKEADLMPPMCVCNGIDSEIVARKPPIRTSDGMPLCNPGYFLSALRSLDPRDHDRLSLQRVSDVLLARSGLSVRALYNACLRVCNARGRPDGLATGSVHHCNTAGPGCHRWQQAQENKPGSEKMLKKQPPIRRSAAAKRKREKQKVNSGSAAANCADRSQTQCQ